MLDMYNETMQSTCQTGPGLPIFQNVGAKRFLFKNIACLHCNMDKDFPGNLSPCGYYKSFGDGTKYGISFNLQSTVNNDQTKQFIPVRYLGESSLLLLEQGRCSHGYADLQVRKITSICL